MKIIVLGAGALGSIIGAHLVRAGEEEVGVRHMMLSMAVRRPGFTVQQALERMERFATKVMPLV